MVNPQRRNIVADSDAFETALPAAEADMAADRPAPTWFPQTLRPLPPEDLADRYRALRTEAYPERGRLRDHADNDADYRQPRRAKAIRRPDEEMRSGAMRAPVYVAAGFCAALAGGLIGYGATQYHAIGDKAASMLALVTPDSAAVAEPRQAALPETTVTITKKPVSTATLDVSDVSGGINSLIPMMLHAEPAIGGEDLILKISGLPESAYLTAGHKAGETGWQLAAAEADGVKLVVPRATEPKYDIAIAAFEAKTGQLAAPIKEITVAIDSPEITIAPASAVPETVTIKSSAIPAPQPDQVASIAVSTEAQSLAAKGDILLKSGDLAMARRFYEQAFAKGSVAAAVGAGKTYDPVVYAALKVQGLKPDPLRAMEWYMRASAAGNSDAAAAIEALKQATP